MRALGFLLALIALLAAACGGGTAMEEAAPTVESAPPASGADRPKAPPIEGVTLEGERVSLAHFRGRPVFVNVWSSW